MYIYICICIYKFLYTNIHIRRPRAAGLSSGERSFCVSGLGVRGTLSSCMVNLIHTYTNLYIYKFIYTNIHIRRPRDSGFSSGERSLCVSRFKMSGALVYIYVYTYIHICLYVYIYVYVYTNLYVCKYTYTPASCSWPFFWRAQPLRFWS